jgi:hypothetical protein
MSNYSLSFTGSALRKAESLLLAQYYLDTDDWQAVRKAAVNDDLLMIHSPSSRKRVASELIKRLNTLNTEELHLFVAAPPTVQGLILWVAVCRTYRFAEDFSREVIAERFKGTSATITTGVFEGFYDEQASLHSELRSISEKTHGRLRNQFMQMLREANLINESGVIQQVFLPPTLETLLDAARRGESTLFPTAR